MSSNITELQSLYEQNGSQFPSLDTPFKPSSLDDDPKVLELSKLVVAAAHQVIAIVRPPRDTIREGVNGMYQSVALGFVVDVNIPEVLNEAPNQTLHVDEIASATGCEPSYVARMLRYLASRHIFREVTPDVFANNRISSALIKSNGKTVAELKAKPLEKYENSGIAASVGYVSSEVLKSSSSIIDFIKSSGKAGASPFNMAYGTDKTIWDWYMEPDREWQYKRFLAVMKTTAARYKDQIFQDAYDWKRLESTDVVVDVGGNIGTVTLAIARKFTEPQFVIQDLPPVIQEAKSFWGDNYPEAIKNGRVRLEAHSFFEPQPVKGAAVYFLRFVLHNWPDSECVKIMKNIREAASSSSKLILFDNTVPYACADPTVYHGDVERRTAPYPLIPNLGKGGGLGPTGLDMQMLNLFNGAGRSIKQFVELGDASGWKLDSARNEELTILTFSTA